MKKCTLLLCLFLASCGWANLDDVKAHAKARWKELGYTVTAYEGYQWGYWLGGNKGGAKVWYTLRRIPDNGVTYSGYLTKWDDEYQVYGPRAIDAIQPN